MTLTPVVSLSAVRALLLRRGRGGGREGGGTCRLTFVHLSPMHLFCHFRLFIYYLHSCSSSASFFVRSWSTCSSLRPDFRRMFHFRFGHRLMSVAIMQLTRHAASFDCFRFVDKKETRNCNKNEFAFTIGGQTRTLNVHLELLFCFYGFECFLDIVFCRNQHTFNA
jgi:hypothetical protein